MSLPDEVRNYNWPRPTLSPNHDHEAANNDRSIEYLNSLLPESETWQRPSLVPLQDLEESKSLAVAEVNDHMVRAGAKVSLASLYKIAQPAVNANATKDEQQDLLNTLAKTSVREDSTTALQHAVLHTAELLELVLSFLPSPDLWRMTHVCQSWNHLVFHSPTLRRVLGFTSSSEPRTPELRFSPERLYSINPVLSSLNLIHDDTTSNHFPRSNINFPARWRTVDAPWRDLQVFEPPVQRVFLQSSWLDKYLECETGITAGMVADRVELSRVGVLKLWHGAG